MHLVVILDLGRSADFDRWTEYGRSIDYGHSIECRRLRGCRRRYRKRTVPSSLAPRMIPVCNITETSKNFHRFLFRF